MSGLGGLNKSPNGLVLGMVQLQLPVVETKEDLANQTTRIVDMVGKARRNSPNMDLVVFPEYALHGLSMDTNPEIMCDMEGPEVAAFKQAWALGFDDFRFAEQDQDLGNLVQDPAYLELRQAWADGLGVRAKDRALTIDAGSWSEPFDLVDREGGLTPPAASARLLLDNDGLTVEMFLECRGLADRPPWQTGGGGVLATLLAPENLATGEGRLAVDFGFGMDEGMPAGAMRLGDRWQRIAELTPKFRMDPDTGRLGLTIHIPWSATGVLHPLVDAPLGVNLTFIRQGAEDEPGRAAWVADPATGQTHHSWRRGIPVTTRWSASQAPALQGRVTDLVIRGQQLALESIALVTADDQPADLHVVVRDHDSQVAFDNFIRLEGSAGLRPMANTLSKYMHPSHAYPSR